MRWLVDNDMLERDEEAEKLLGSGEGLPDYDFGSAFRITDSGRELLEEIGQEKGSNKHSPTCRVRIGEGSAPVRCQRPAGERTGALVA